MDHENRVIRIDDEYDLEESAILRRTPDQVSLACLHEWKRCPGVADGALGFFWPYVMPCDVLHNSRISIENPRRPCLARFKYI